MTKCNKINIFFNYYERGSRTRQEFNHFRKITPISEQKSTFIKKKIVNEVYTKKNVNELKIYNFDEKKQRILFLSTA